MIQQQILQLSLQMIFNSFQICKNCGRYQRVGAICTFCQKQFYCSKYCQDTDLIKHSKTCTKSKNIQKKQKKGLVGLQNLGNTCYINSIIQCLSHTVQLTQYFLNKSYINQINSTNQDGYQGKLAENYAKVIQNLWTSNKQTFRIDQFKRKIGQINVLFANNSQHDAHQFLIFLINSLHEDLKRKIIKTPIFAQPQTYGKPDYVCAESSWLYYMSKNQSIITDTMTGLFKSQIRCKQCNRQSINFQPFRTINLTIPNSVQKQFTLYVLYANYTKPLQKYTLQYNQIPLDKEQKLKQRLVGNAKDRYKLYFLNDFKEIEQYKRMEKHQFQTRLLNQKIFLIQLTKEQCLIYNKFALTCYFTRKDMNFKPIGYKRPFFINLSKQTGLAFTIKILKYLYSQIYNYPQKKTALGIQNKTYSAYQQQMLQKNPFKLILIKRIKKQGKFVNQLNSKQVILQDMLICDTMHKLIPLVKQQDWIQNDGGVLNNLWLDRNQIQQIKNRYQLAIQIQQQSQKQFDFTKLYSCFQQANKTTKIKKGQNLYRLFQKFRQGQNLNSDCQWYCRWCQKNVKFSKKFQIFRTPDILIIHLMRFQMVYDGVNNKYIKNDIPVNFPLILQLSNHVVDHLPINSYINFVKSNGYYVKPAYNFQPFTKPSQKFQLYGYVNHIGKMMNSGHYTAYVQNDKKWYLFNDSRYTLKKDQEREWKEAYILFYRRIVK